MRATHYGPGNAWMLVNEHAIGVLENGLTAGEAELLLEALASDGGAAVRDHPLGLLVLVRDEEGWRLDRRWGAPAVIDAMRLPDRISPFWESDRLPDEGVLEAGGATDEALLPIGHGVVRTIVIRVDLAAFAQGDPVADLAQSSQTIVERDPRDEVLQAPPSAPAPAPAAAPDLASAPAAEAAPGSAPEPEPEPGAQPDPSAAEPVPAAAPTESALRPPAFGWGAPPAPAPAQPAQREPVQPEPVPASEPEPAAAIVVPPRAVEPVEEAFDEPIDEHTVVMPGRERAQTGPAVLSAPAPSASAQPAATSPAFMAPSASASEPSTASAPVTAPGGLSGLIDSVPGFVRPAVAEPAPAIDEAMRATSSPQPPTEAAAPLGDHDGRTLTVAEARRLRGEHTATQHGEPEPSSMPATGPLVLSVLCEQGHVSPPGSTRCLHCGAAVRAGSDGRRNRPDFAVLVSPSGERVPLGRGVVVGRRPRTSRAEHDRLPRLVAVESPNEDVSRSHLEVRCDEWTIVAVDLDSTNGTVLLQPGRPPQRLRAGQPTIIAIGDRLDLGDGAVVAIEAL